jgi:26S proteasome regulatory subunit N7
LEAYQVAFDKTASLGSKIDMIFTTIRIGFFFNDLDIVSKNIDKAKV